MATKHPKYPANAYVSDFTLVQPAMGSRLYEDDDGSILVGHQTDITHALRLLRITLFGPTKQELGG